MAQAMGYSKWKPESFADVCRTWRETLSGIEHKIDKHNLGETLHKTLQPVYTIVAVDLNDDDHARMRTILAELELFLEGLLRAMTQPGRSHLQRARDKLRAYVATHGLETPPSVNPAPSTSSPSCLTPMWHLL